jgi:hypothetical protein
MADSKKIVSMDELTHYDELIKDHIEDEVDKVSTIAVSETAPTKDNVVAWIDSSDTEDYEIPEIKDDETNETDTWSSKKISDELSAIQGTLNMADTTDIDALFATTSDIDNLG